MNHENHIFISYARKDQEFALKLAQDLRSAGVTIWVDKFDIPPGAPWDRTIQNALKTCESLLVILSPSSVDSENVQDEVAFILKQKKPIIPVLYRICEIPYRLIRLQQIDFIDDYNQGLTALLAHLGVDRGIPAKVIDKEQKHR